MLFSDCNEVSEIPPRESIPTELEIVHQNGSHKANYIARFAAVGNRLVVSPLSSAKQSCQTSKDPFGKMNSSSGTNHKEALRFD